MPEITIKLPDIGEGIALAEISEWMVEVGDWIQEDDTLGVMLTDKAAVEIPSSQSGKVVWRAGEPGDSLAVGAPLVRIEVPETERADASSAAQGAPAAVDPPSPSARADGSGTRPGATMPPVHVPPPATETAPAAGRALAAPAVRQRARDLGLDLTSLGGTGPDGRITHADLDRNITGSRAPEAAAPAAGITETPIIGLRRKIAEQMARANSHIPQITIVEEVDVTELERTRTAMNAGRSDTQPKLTLLPLVIRGVIAARSAAPDINARYDDETGVLARHDAVHFGIATQTERGLVVPVLRHAEARAVWDIAAEIARLAAAARDGSLARDELSGSTITVTSLGPLGAIATTPIVNYPEVAIVGVNRKQVRPHWNGRDIVAREMMNLSASFDHRIVDGWNAAVFIARLKTLLETPALLFT